MSDGGQVGEARLDALMWRMLGGLLLFGAAVLLGLTLVLLAQPRVITPGGSALLLPGTQGRHTIDAAALPVLGLGAALMGVPGLLALALGRRRTRFVSPAVRGAASNRSFRRPVAVLCCGVALLVVVLLRH